MYNPSLFPLSPIYCSTFCNFFFFCSGAQKSGLDIQYSGGRPPTQFSAANPQEV